MQRTRSGAGPRPVIGLTCSTLVLPDVPGVPRHAIVDAYVGAVLSAGGLPWMLPNIAPAHAQAYVERLDGIVLTGGLDVDPYEYGQEPHPRLDTTDQVRDAFELALARAARERGTPILAICRGLQVLNVALGGTLLQDIPSQVTGAIRHRQDDARLETLSHAIDVVPETHLARIAGSARVRVNSFHHQAVAKVAAGLVVTARSADGVVEALEDPAHDFTLGVQWHPERRPGDPLTKALFVRLVAAADAFRGEVVAGAGRRAEQAP